MDTASTPRKQYVVGFAFNADQSKVVLIEKKRPDWQAGKLNGPGGRVEPFDADPAHAMCREFKEECGILTQTDEWLHYMTMDQDFGIVSVYCAFGDKFMQAAQQTDEDVRIADVDLAILRHQAVSNVFWMIACALDDARANTFMHVTHKPGFTP